MSSLSILRAHQIIVPAGEKLSPGFLLCERRRKELTKSVQNLIFVLKVSQNPVFPRV